MAASPAGAVDVAVRPAAPFIEVRDGEQFLNFDLVVHNLGGSPLRLAAVREKVFDAAGRLEVEREVNGNGSPPALTVLGATTVQPGGYADFFQPFDRYDGRLDLSRIRFELVFLRAEKAIPPVAEDGDAVAVVDVRPIRPPMQAYCLPLAGHVLVHDGHDLLSHHRRRDLVAHAASRPEAAVNANLYAYDFVRIDRNGRLFDGSPDRKENWFSFGAPILSPTEGVVVAAVDGVPDNTLEHGSPVAPANAEAVDPNGLGNHVLIRAADGRVSWLLHMEAGTVAVRAGQKVERGQLLGRVGFSGDALFPHLHYTVTNGAAYPSQGVPSVFRDFRREGDRGPGRDARQIDTGDILDRTPNPSCPGGSGER